MEVSSQMLQRSSVSFRRQGSSGRVWENLNADRSGPLLNVNDRSGPLLTSYSGPISAGTPTTAGRRSHEIQLLRNIRSGREEKFQPSHENHRHRESGSGGGGSDGLSRVSSLPIQLPTGDQKYRRRNGGGAYFFIRCCTGSPPTA
ncbi:unnamed protein product [Linum trigynum]|uniref:Uncharacterized protein n=1 Tax=Linum trigynum TaxID=586398 RepID=A0AAV2F2V8_9ROSI